MQKSSKTALGALAVAAALLVAAPALSGEVNGRGKHIPGAVNAASECAFSGLNDDPTSANFPGKIQNFAHFLFWFAEAVLGIDRLHPLDAPNHPSTGCNPTA